MRVKIINGLSKLAKEENLDALIFKSGEWPNMGFGMVNEEDWFKFGWQCGKYRKRLYIEEVDNEWRRKIEEGKDALPIAFFTKINPDDDIEPIRGFKDVEIVLYNCEKYIADIFHIFKLWLIDNVTIGEIERVLVSFRDQIILKNK